MISGSFSDRLFDAIDKKQNPSVVGLDPRIGMIPDELKEGRDENNPSDAAQIVLDFNKAIINAVHDIVPAVKPQIAFYEVFGPAGIKAFLETCSYAKDKGLIVIADAKRNDIGSTAKAYAKAFLGNDAIDAITVNPYFGIDGVKPFLEYEGKGAFILVKTSNPSSGEIQDVKLENGLEVYRHVASLVKEWGEEKVGNRGYSDVGAVVGATYPEQAKQLREDMPKAIFLVPGYGAQGGTADDVVPAFNSDGYGAIVNSSRGIIFAYKKLGGDFAEAAREAATRMKEDIKASLVKAGKWLW